MAEIIRRRTYTARVTYRLECQVRASPGCGFSFPCDAAGNVPADLNPDAARNLAEARDEAIHTPLVIVRSEDEVVTPALLRCDCGATVTLGLHGADADCTACGAEYNTAGQRLAPRAQWGWDTGEVAADYYAGQGEE